MRYALCVNHTKHEHDEPITRADVVTTLTPSELGEAMDAIARRRAPVVYFGTVVVCVAFFAFAIYALVLGVRTSFAPFFLMITATVMLPWTRHRLNALLFRRTAPVMFEPYTIEAFAPGLLFLRQGQSRSETRLDSFAVRAETKRVFAFGRADTAICIAIPKRAFTDPALLEAFREVFAGRAKPKVIAEAVHTFGQDDAPDAIHFQLEPDEQLHAVRLVITKSWVRFLPWAVNAFVAALSLTIFVTRGALKGTVVTIVLFALTWLFRARFIARLRTTPPPTSIVLRDDTLEFTSSAGNLVLQWADLGGLVEDESFMVVLVRKNMGLFIPKRALDAARMAFIRAHVPPAR